MCASVCIACACAAASLLVCACAPQSHCLLTLRPGRMSADLRAGVARTPLEPTQTFTDDPLRVLRAIRFAARFDLKVDSVLAAAAASDTVREALDTKVSRERLATEVQKMMEGPDPIRAVYLLASLSLWDVVFRMPEEEEVHREDRVGGAVVSSAATLPPEGFAVAGLHCMLLAHRLAQPAVNMTSLLPAGQLKHSVLWWSGLCLPLRHHMTRFKKANTQTLVEFLHRESLKGLPLTDATNVSKVVNSSDALRAAVREHADGKELDRVAVGLVVKELKELWRPALLVACAAELYDDPALGPALVAAEAAGGAWAEPVANAEDVEAEPEEDVTADGAAAESTIARAARVGALAADGSIFHPSCLLTLRARGEEKMEFGVPFTDTHLVRCSQYVAFADQLEAAGLHEAWKIKPPVTSKDIMKQLDVKGPAVGKCVLCLQLSRSAVSGSLRTPSCCHRITAAFPSPADVSYELVLCDFRYNTLALHWQLANPSGTAEECMEMLREHKAQGN
eukprot:COSAG02_NODE_2842_length_7911_cov_6.273682_7_plen_508_part_00